MVSTVRDLRDFTDQRQQRNSQTRASKTKLEMTPSSSADVERQNLAKNNPYAGMPEPKVLSSWHPLNLLRRMVYMCISLFGLHHFKTWDTILHSPKVRHEWFVIGLASSIAILSIKAYVEMYSGKLRKQEVNYKNFPHSTHAVMFLLLLNTVAFNVSLWPAYGWNSLLILTMIGFGLVLQLTLLLPTYAQNILGFVLLTFFLQTYA